jgi:SRSO17 transposase
MREGGLTVGCTLADAAYGMCAEFRRGLSKLEISCAVGIAFAFLRTLRLTENKDAA